ncbi:MAG TPA: ankyrin repeat domain-containing protein [Elusimicrobiota bacterium]|nr:ankyrin repeat domain-containing protein [Elusimicrobiota bacterium]
MRAVAAVIAGALLSAGCASTPLIQAVKSGNSGQVSSLLDAGADVKPLDPVWGYSALELAACDGNEEIVKEFIRHKTDLNGVTATPLYRAATCPPRHPGVVKMLLDAGAKVDDLSISLISNPSYVSENPAIARMIKLAQDRQLGLSAAAPAEPDPQPPSSSSAATDENPAAPGAKPWWGK